MVDRPLRKSTTEQLAVMANNIEHIEKRLDDGKGNFAMLEKKIEDGLQKVEQNVDARLTEFQRSVDLKFSDLSNQMTAMTKLLSSSPRSEFFEVVKANKWLFVAFGIALMFTGAAVLFALQLGFLSPDDVKKWRP